MYSSEYTSGFSGSAASHLVASPSPRHEGNVGQAPWDRREDLSMPDREKACQCSRVIGRAGCLTIQWISLAERAPYG